jgi:hypothetical protein
MIQFASNTLSKLVIAALLRPWPPFPLSFKMSHRYFLPPTPTLHLLNKILAGARLVQNIAGTQFTLLRVLSFQMGRCQTELARP